MRMYTMKRAARRGFSLMELLLVLVIIAVLAGIVAPMMFGKADKAKIEAARQNVKNLEDALSAFKLDNSRAPTDEEGLGALVDNPGNLKHWTEPYMKKIPLDPWDQPFKYRSTQAKSKMGFDVWSVGPDGQDGTDDDIASWQ